MPNNEYQNLGPKTLFIFIFGNTMLAVMVLLVLLVAWWLINFFGNSQLIDQSLPLINSLMPLLIIVDLIFFIIMTLIARWQYTNYKFKIDDDAFRVMHGILTREEIAMPYRRIESVDLKQTLFYQILGVS
ncbi:MAG: hypothetical protein C3F02_02835 [Parcubacteria group bacterium]|nr:MAG: hypothetical protein C3F02_02835 [Parcubacteria group bacterium]